MNYSRLFHAIVVVGATWAAGCGGGGPDPGPPNVTTGQVSNDAAKDDPAATPDLMTHDMVDAVDAGWHPTK